MIEVRKTAAFSKWFGELRDHNARMRIVTRIRRMEIGNLGDVKPVGEGISEARIAYGPGYRLYFVQQGQEIIILLCGGDKSTQGKDIASAKQMAKEI
ncbi:MULTISPECIES: type II toxin-antitoxin system RelE/ParE family toxin [unclassified Neorhizobium]|uniref:type II toxin-antitoxin system RelE/ParE family toxin n=1 Tax=unclassified Neorhizobium TaxID=2629175 RepID=UPI001FF12BC3|nr:MULTISPECIES: type II toxin-antitoxin system RelE/ParE family toxin [unclassified Neorhizobium]MCJ9671366.1 type II toxin-antitoxin system RelE/ParE family toxin [Neorhizobium sp. SHOUNA12B]MCJ9745792.1 type II toxin-antitoxin system RelE/ParE family toxin [Neorhizobium sp. SHOUNA12A]